MFFQSEKKWLRAVFSVEYVFVLQSPCYCCKLILGRLSTGVCSCERVVKRRKPKRRKSVLSRHLKVQQKSVVWSLIFSSVKKIVNWCCSSFEGMLPPWLSVSLSPEAHYWQKNLMCTIYGNHEAVSSVGLVQTWQFPGLHTLLVTRTPLVEGRTFTLQCCANHSDYRCPD